MSPRALLVALLVATPYTTSNAQTQYKVVGPDGSVTYTDRAPSGNVGRITALGRDSRPAEAATPLPLELRQVVARFPVILYAASECQPCENGRRLLAQRGIPLVERQIISEEDTDALQRLTGGRSVPALTIGAQTLRGFSELDWHSYLDAAGYPRESRLPRDYKAPPSAPLVARQLEQPAPVGNAAPLRAAPAEPARAESPDTPASAIRF